MKSLLGAIAVGALVWTSAAMAGPDNANVTSYTATCTGIGTATSVRIERSFESPTPNSRPRAGLAFHIVGSNQVVLFADTPGLIAQSEAARTICTVTGINDEPVEPFLAPIVVLPPDA
jgi:hypothetical protein